MFPQENKIREQKKLDGIYRFCPDVDGVSLKEGWESGLKDYREIAVPASWIEQYDDLMEFFGYGWYETDVFIPCGWSDKEIWLQFGSVCTNCDVYLDGGLVGSHSGGSLPFEFNVTAHVTAGSVHRMSIMVDGHLDPWGLPPAQLEDQEARVGFFNSNPGVTYDFFPYMGIHRDIYLYCTNKKRIESIRITCDLDELPRTHAGICSRIRLSEPGCGIMSLELLYQGKVMAGRKIQLEGFEDNVIETSMYLPDAVLWGIGRPNLYQMRITWIEDGREVDSYCQEFGIRKIEIKENKLYLNGEPVFLKGFGKHEDYSIIGKGLNHSVMVKDFGLLEWIGANSFRTSHYPYAEEILRYADHHGFLVIDETPFVGLNPRMYRADIQECACRIIDDLIERDYNHPSVIMWSLANEPDVCTEEGRAFFREMAETARTQDKSRPITYAAHLEADHNLGMECFDVVCLNKYYGWYFHPGDLEQGTKELGLCMDRFYEAFKKPVLLAEFGADAIAGMHYMPPQMFSEEYQEEMIRRQYLLAKEKSYCIGTHVWAFADFKTAQSTTRVILNRKGVFTRERQPKMAAHTLKELWSKP